MRLSTRYYRLKRKNKKGYVALVFTACAIFVLLIGGAIVAFHPSHPPVDTIGISAPSSMSSGSDSSMYSSTSTAKSTTSSKKSNTTASGSDLSGYTSIAGSSSSSQSSSSEPTVYAVMVGNIRVTSTVSYEDAVQRAMAVAQAENQKTAESVAQSYRDQGYDVQIKGGN